MKKKYDVVLVICILIIAGGIWGIFKLLPTDAKAVVVVKQNNKEIGRYSLGKEQRISIPDAEGGYNIMIISRGEVSITDADCPDQLCVKQRAISHKRESIICLPHDLIIQIDNGKESNLDAVTY